MTDEPSREPTVAPDATDHGQTPKPGEYPGDVRVLDVGGRQFVLVGTAHISRQSVDLVREVIERERPDCVCVELDPQRYAALAEEKRFEAQDLRQIIANRQLATLLMNLVLGSYQKRLGMKLGVTPGSELLEATKVAEQFDIPISLCDRDIRITLRRAWHSLSLWRKFMLMSSLLASAFESPDISEEELTRIRDKDVLSELMSELGDSLPELKRSLIDERDAYLAQKIRESEGSRLVAVVGAGHLEGMIRAIEANHDVDIKKI
jgi:pheromone shutdown-related protein TraB